MAWGVRQKQMHSRREGSTLKERRWDRRMKEKLQSGGQLPVEHRVACCSSRRAASASSHGASSCSPSIARSCCSACCHVQQPPASTSAAPTTSLFQSAFQKPAAFTIECRTPLFAATASRGAHAQHNKRRLQLTLFQRQRKAGAGAGQQGPHNGGVGGCEGQAGGKCMETAGNVLWAFCARAGAGAGGGR